MELEGDFVLQFQEFAIRGTFCDLAIKMDGKVEFLIEAKAIGRELKDNHLR